MSAEGSMGEISGVVMIGRINGCANPHSFELENAMQLTGLPNTYISGDIVRRVLGTFAQVQRKIAPSPITAPKHHDYRVTFRELGIGAPSLTTLQRYL